MKLSFDQLMEKLPLIISKINDGIIRFSKWDLKKNPFEVTVAASYS